jgi:predicted nucleotidyltransferase
MSNIIHQDLFLSTNSLKALSLLAKYSDQEFYEREIARRLGISYGSANMVLNDLYSVQYLSRQKKGNMYFYRFNVADPVFSHFKILVNILLLRPLIKPLKRVSMKIVLFGSCARAADHSKSDIDLFIVSDDKSKVLGIIKKYKFNKGFEGLIIEPAVFSPTELLKSEKKDNEFLSLVSEGIVLWDRLAHEDSF